MFIFMLLLGQLPRHPTGILQQHIVAGTFLSTQLTNGQNLTTLSGDVIQVTVDDDNLLVNGIQVTETNLIASNGVLHKIEQVIILDTDPTSCLLSQISGTECCVLEAIPGSGDLDYNNLLLVTDIIIVVNFILGVTDSPNACVEIVGDVNFDVKIDVVDVINIVNTILNA